jgi:hypothetical protein
MCTWVLDTIKLYRIIVFYFIFQEKYEKELKGYQGPGAQRCVLIH